MNKGRYTLSEINSFGQDEFVRVIGPVFEHSPWIAEAAWSLRPFQSIENLHHTLTEITDRSLESKQLELIRAHPDLVGRAALRGTLTTASTQEQASAGLSRLSPDEVATFQKHNQTYRDKFGFPFVICARLNKKEAILSGFQDRLHNTRTEEMKTALGEISKIAWLRLQDIIQA